LAKDADDFTSGQKFNLSKFFAGERLSPQHIDTICETVGPIIAMEVQNKLGHIERSQQRLKGALLLIVLLVPIGAMIYNNISKTNDLKSLKSIIKQIQTKDEKE